MVVASIVLANSALPATKGWASDIPLELSANERPSPEVEEKKPSRDTSVKSREVAPAIGSKSPKGKAVGSNLGKVAGSIRNLCALLSIGIVLLQNPKETAASQALAKTAMFSGMKQSSNFLSNATWLLIIGFLVSSAIADL